MISNASITLRLFDKCIYFLIFIIHYFLLLFIFRYDVYLSLFIDACRRLYNPTRLAKGYHYHNTLCKSGSVLHSIIASACVWFVYFRVVTQVAGHAMFVSRDTRMGVSRLINYRSSASSYAATAA